MSDSKVTTKFVVTKATAGLIGGLRDKGDRYGHAGTAALAHALALAIRDNKNGTLPRGAQAAYVEATGYDKGTVCRVVGRLKSDPEAFEAALALILATTNPNPAKLDEAVAVGQLFARTHAPKPDTDTGDVTGGASEEGAEVGSANNSKAPTDPTESVYAWVNEAGISEKMAAARINVLLAILVERRGQIVGGKKVA